MDKSKIKQTINFMLIFTALTLSTTTSFATSTKTPESVYKANYESLISSDTVDDFTDVRTLTVIKEDSKQYINAFLNNVIKKTPKLPKDSIGLRCDIDKNKTLMLTFDTGQIFKATGTDVEVLIRIGKNETLKFVGKTYSNSYKSGYVILKDQVIFNQLKSEDKMKRELKIRIIGSSSIIDRTFSMIAFVEKSVNLLKACN